MAGATNKIISTITCANRNLGCIKRRRPSVGMNSIGATPWSDVNWTKLTLRNMIGAELKIEGLRECGVCSLVVLGKFVHMDIILDMKVADRRAAVGSVATTIWILYAQEMT